MECPAPALITQRRQFLRAFGLTAAGAALPIPLLLADSPEHSIKLQLDQLAQALQLLYPETQLAGSWRRRDRLATGFSTLAAGDIVAVIKAAGLHSPPTRSP